MFRLIINTPDITYPAGVSNHYLGLQQFFSKDVIYNQYKTNECIRREFPKMPKFIRLALRFLLIFIDLFKFLFLIISHKKSIVLLNPSLNKTAMQRDALLLRVAKLFGCKVAVFIHGWDSKYFESLLNGTSKFSTAWQKADCFFVLASDFKKGLQKVGVKSPIYLTTTKVNDNLVGDFKNEKVDDVANILFLARIKKEKGIYTAIDAFEMVKKSHKNVKLKVVGMGEELENAEKYVMEKGIPDVLFTGPLSGHKLREAFSGSHIYLLPTTHGEGMPTSVLEAMAFGLPIITRPVGGVVDFFEEGAMGYLLESLDPQDYAASIISLVENPEKSRAISLYNESFALQNFMASKVAKELESTLRRL